MAERKTSEAAPGRHSHAIPAPSFPTHNSPRTWFLTQALSPLAVRLIRLLLAHGDYVVACLPPHELADDACSAEFRALAQECRAPAGRYAKDREGWKDRIRGIRCDGRAMGQCVAAVAEAVAVFGRIDIMLCCRSEAVVGTLEEVVATGQSSGPDLVRDQFETIFFSQVNFIKAALPQFRAQHTGHLIVLTSVGGHLGTPGLAVHTAATWALEGYCDSLAYEIAPFNIRVTIVQPQTEVQTLTNRIVLAPPLPAYEAAALTTAAGAASSSATHAAYASDDPDGDPDGSPEPPAPRVRDMLTRVLNLHPASAVPPASAATAASVAGTAAPATPVVRYPRLPAAALDRLVLETVHALTAIGGHENPPARHIVGFEASAAVQEKLKTVSEELEDFVEASLAVDIFDSQLQAEVRAGRVAAQAEKAAQQVAQQTAAQQAAHQQQQATHAAADPQATAE
ncbi:NAD(P)-binding domain protein [Niveomyces insectorum RCEF 264]|uniref:NAD(P)-binding domain protein n=1 Tax=Niveomyces insectorum RCEF 264 TaxID=1081102 RepID=A0A168AI49_9HYPO|nr:NAD(P)-binding domain protein [Niveomyces insectorum RCEF 264]